MLVTVLTMAEAATIIRKFGIRIEIGIVMEGISYVFAYISYSV